MLSIGKLADAGYYLDSVARSVEDYYTGSGEAPGEWLGRGAVDLGLVGQVDPDHLHAVLAGTDRHGEQLLGGKAAAKGRLAGFDLTFSAPKSVSLLFGLGDERVAGEARAAHDAAVAEALWYLEAEAVRVRRGRDGVRVLPAVGLVAAGFRHRTSRAGDPQLHTHVLVANLAQGPDGRWSALDGRQLYAHARTAGFLYQAALRAELARRLGVRFGPVVNGMAEVAGFTRSELEVFSARRREIVAAMAERGVATARGAQAATLDTRQAKTRPARVDGGPLASVNARDYGVDPGSLGGRWRAQAAGVGLDEATVAARCGPGRQPAPFDEPAVTGRLLGPTGLTLRASSFDRRDILRGLAEAAVDGAPVDQLRAVAGRVATTPGLVRLGGPDRPEVTVGGRDVIRRADGRIVTTPTAGEGRWTTADLLAAEQTVLDAARAWRAVGAAVVDPALVEEVIASRVTLAEEQAAMVRRLCGSGAGIDVVVGAAGTGKTFALDTARAAWAAAGITVVGAALSARAAGELTAGSGIDAGTIAQLLIDADRYPTMALTPGGVLVVDEAGMVGTRTLARLVDLAAKTSTKLVLVGDPRQLPEIDAGGTLAALAAQVGAVTLLDNRRQEAAWEREALAALRAGRVADAVAAYGDNGRVHLAPTAEAAMAAMVADWTAGRTTGQVAPVMLARRRADVEALNRLARAARKDAGELTGPELATPTGRAFAEGDLVVGTRNDRRAGFLNGQHGTVTAVDIDTGTLTVATIRKASQEVEPVEVTLPATYVAENLAHGYALTGHKAQGMTADRALVLGDDATTREAGYVALSRGRHANDLYWVAPTPTNRRPEHGYGADPLAEITRALATTGAKTTATSGLPSVDELARRPLDQLEAEHRDLVTRLRTTIPADVSDQLAATRHWQTEAVRGLEAATAARDATAAAIGQLLRRRRDEHAALAARLTADDAALAGWAARQTQLADQAAHLEQAATARTEWLAAHSEQITHAARLGSAIDQRTHHLLVAAQADPPPWLVATLGPQPDSRTSRASWRHAATELLAWRDRHHITDPHHALGPPGLDPTPDAGRSRLANLIDTTARSLGHDLPLELRTELGLDNDRSRGR